MQDLADTVWAEPQFRSVVDRLRRAWIAYEARVLFSENPSLTEIAKAVKTAAILACSDDPRHRRVAFQVVTTAYELHGTSALPLDQAVRVVLARLGNFPSMSTRSDVSEARNTLPVGLLAEELIASDRLTVQMGSDRVILTDFQHDLWTRLTRKRRVALTAPTSAGKSFVLKGFLATLFENPGHYQSYTLFQRALSLVMSPALSGQVGLIRRDYMLLPRS